MFGLETLDLIIGLITIYLAFGIATTASVEAISSLLKLRAKNLEKALAGMLSGTLNDNEKLIDKVYQNPLVQTLSKGTNGKPSYIPKAVVSQVVDSLMFAKNTGATLSAAIEAMPDKDSGGKPNHTKALFTEFARLAGDDIEKFKTDIENHFDRVMERSIGWYKRKVQMIALLISAVLVIGSNVDTIEISRTLSSNPEARAQLVAAASGMTQAARQVLQDSQNPDTANGETQVSTDNTDSAAMEEVISSTNEAYRSISEALKTAETSSIQIGWTETSIPENPAEWISKIFGLLVSIFAVSLGAPFWFNILQKIAQIRATGAPQVAGNSQTDQKTP